MASSSKFYFNSLLLCVAFLSMVAVSLAREGEAIPSFSLSPPMPSPATTCAVPQNQCASQCNRRCSATSHLNNCLLFCNKCCNTCLCVPPGTYGNKECCPCYNNWKTKEGGPKCP
ncbi:hypothetical protein ABFS83_04G051700 [Erythranthe nasuta]